MNVNYGVWTPSLLMRSPLACLFQSKFFVHHAANQCCGRTEIFPSVRRKQDGGTAQDGG